MPKETPLQAMKRQYGSKEKLIDEVADAAREGDEDTSDAKERLKSVSNKKLLRIGAVASAIKERYGSVDKLVEALATAGGKVKDSDYIAKMKTLAPARLLELVTAAERRVRRKAKAA